MTDQADNGGKNQGRRFQPGQSGNPAGKPKGTKHKALAALDAIGAEAAREVLQSTIAAAKRGNSRAAEILLARLWPARKSRPVMLDLPAVASADGVTAALAAVIEAMAAGDLAPDEAAAVAAVIEGQRRAIETTDFERRLAALEERNGSD
ncbi:DUF5681 domain-containing protein [Acidiphilium sp. AL]|uniref:DUF5681 domain-containing protein n=1 Tax=Acidiphilium sp. AL TaxID=2871704 RepID=UPI0021CB918D|nr:DUF5681 domain-containing protein [Acidiphilium sp. AL]MCU4161748.1 DUF5681 domain-containing protein [Acidiphilium sp. AL]